MFLRDVHKKNLWSYKGLFLYRNQMPLLPWMKVFVAVKAKFPVSLEILFTLKDGQLIRGNLTRYFMKGTIFVNYLISRYISKLIINQQILLIPVPMHSVWIRIIISFVFHVWYIYLLFVYLVCGCVFCEFSTLMLILMLCTKSLCNGYQTLWVCEVLGKKRKISVNCKGRKCELMEMELGTNKITKYQDSKKLAKKQPLFVTEAKMIKT